MGRMAGEAFGGDRLPVLHRPPRPMEPILWPEPFDDPRWRFQIKWDGVRCLAALHRGRVQLWNRRGLERTQQYPELVDELPDALGRCDAVLDGEVVALVDGRPSFPAVMKRALAQHPEALVGRIPIRYAVFDLLAWRGEDLTDRPLDERLAMLQAAVTPSPHIHLTETTPERGTTLFAAVQEHQLEGIVAKAAASPYRPGPSPFWRKVKVRRRIACAVIGYTLRGGLPRSLLLGAYAGGRLVYLGSISSGLSSHQWRKLQTILAQQPPAPPLVTGPAPAGTERRWIRPPLAVIVEFSEFTPDGRLRAPVAVGFAPALPELCQLPADEAVRRTGE